MRTVVCDDHPVVIMGIKAILAGQGSDCEVVGEARNGSQLLDLLRVVPCDLVITDFSMPNGDRQDDGLPMLRRLRDSHPGLLVIVLTVVSNPVLAEAMRKLGVAAVVDKAGMAGDLLGAVRRASGQRGHENAVVEAGEPSPAEATAVTRSGRAAMLSPREAEVVRLYAEGISATRIAAMLNRSIKTISKQKSDAMRKLGLHTNRELYEFARDHGLIT